MEYNPVDSAEYQKGDLHIVPGVDKALITVYWAFMILFLYMLIRMIRRIKREGIFQVCLVPETLRKTNLETLNSGSVVNIETDYYMKGLLTAKGEIHA